MAKQIKIPEEYILTSTTDLKGTITSVSEHFTIVCGYTAEEMIGKPHNMIRHPDNPKELFADLWKTIGKGRPWMGFVRNRAKNGDYYWVKANVSANYKDGNVVGYTSVRTAATQQQITEAEAAYEKIRQGELVINHGFVKTPSAWRVEKLNLFNLISIKATAIMLMAAILVAGVISIATTLSLQSNLKEIKSEWAAFQNTGSKNSESINSALSSEGSNKAELLNIIRSELGYGGMIHQYKNYIIRGDEERVDKVKSKIQSIADALKGYKSLEVNMAETQALDAIESMLKEYEMGLNEATRLVRSGVAPELIDQQVKVSDAEALKALVVIAEEIQREAQGKSSTLTGLLEVSEDKVASNFWIIASGVPIFLLIFYMALFVKIIHPIQNFRKAIMQIERDSQFDQRCSTSIFNDEITQTTGAFDNLLGKIQNAIASVNTVMISVSDGKFSSRVNAELDGDLSALKHSVNKSAESVALTIQELTKIMGAIEQGDFTARYDVDARGELQMLKESVNGSMSVLSSAFSDINVVVSALASGDMSQKINTQYEGEYESVTQSVNLTIDKLNEVVSTVVESANEITSAAAHVKTNSDGLVQKAQEQTENLDLTASASEEMAQSIAETASNTLQVSELVSKSYDEAQSSDQVVKQTINSMQAITESSHKISEIITVIDSIAFQTNLLALNAAVEAARAGDHGRGFAVVAGEVRNLAGKSADAAKDIKSLIEDSLKKVDDGSTYVSKTSEALAHLSESITEVKTSVEHISAANQEQKEAIIHVNSTVGDLTAITSENLRMVNDSQTSTEQINTMSQELNSLVSFFKR